MAGKGSPVEFGAVVSHNYGFGDPLVIKFVDAAVEALREVDRCLTAYMQQHDQKRQYQRQYQCKQQQLRDHVMTINAGSRRRQMRGRRLSA